MIGVRRVPVARPASHRPFEWTARDTVGSIRSIAYERPTNEQVQPTILSIVPWELWPQLYPRRRRGPSFFRLHPFGHTPRLVLQWRHASLTVPPPHTAPQPGFHLPVAPRQSPRCPATRMLRAALDLTSRYPMTCRVTLRHVMDGVKARIVRASRRCPRGLRRRGIAGPRRPRRGSRRPLRRGRQSCARPARRARTRGR